MKATDSDSDTAAAQNNAELEKEEPRTFPYAIEAYVHELDSMADTFPVVMDALTRALKDRMKKLTEFIDRKRLTLKMDDAYDVLNIATELKRNATALSIVPRSFVVSLVSHFDAYMGRLIRVLFYARPHLLHVSEKHVTFAQLLRFDGIEQAREFVVEKEVESILRENHTAHFEWLERKLEMTLRKDLPVWPAFIEVTERRNLFVHSDGVVSSQYLSACEASGFKFAVRPKIGERLTVDKAYFESAYGAMYEIGVKLGHVLWRKVLPAELAESDAELHRLSYELLAAGKYEVVIVLLEFALNTIKKHSSEQIRLFALVNLCIAYEAVGRDQHARQLLASTDWTAKADKFKLAHAVLTADHDSTFKLMRKIGKNGEVEPWAYRKWPLFRKLRESEEFGKVFFEVFGEPLRDIEADAAAAVESLLHAQKPGPGTAARTSTEKAPAPVACDHPSDSPLRNESTR